MKFYECGECGSVKISRDYVKCDKHERNGGMYQILSWGRGGMPEVAKEMLAIKINEKNVVVK